MNIKCGTDIIEIDRIKSSIEELGSKFLDRIYTQNEQTYCESKKMQKYQHYAARFAAKEAVFKALSERLEEEDNFYWKDIEIINCKTGRPFVKLLNEKIKDINNIDLSISHCKNYAIANVVVIFK